MHIFTKVASECSTLIELTKEVYSIAYERRNHFVGPRESLRHPPLLNLLVASLPQVLKSEPENEEF